MINFLFTTRNGFLPHFGVAKSQEVQKQYLNAQLFFVRLIHKDVFFPTKIYVFQNDHAYAREKYSRTSLI